MKKKYAIYTAIFGGYDSLPNINLQFNFDKYEFFCFTDQIIENSYPWKIINTQQMSEGPAVTNRYIKFNAHKFLHEYDFVMYMDGNINLKKSPDYFFSFLKSSSSCVMLSHPSRKTILEEIAACTAYQKINIFEAFYMISFYVKVGYMENFHLTANRLFVRSLIDDKINKCFEQIYTLYLNGPRRDQLHSNYCMWCYKINQIVIPCEKYKEAFEVNSHLREENSSNNFQKRIIHLLTLNLFIWVRFILKFYFLFLKR